ncbi:CLUMA_CG017109, isoform A [Clunio marinus]|uniref:CLUMA_CG017109, isoform A n=1 Tax=Clunio marinus TaxID=568069 RepID=A0A1J1IXV9_9DIPT|nr:CLUMA_CG017109, isoform A [Clunio marinus]
MVESLNLDSMFLKLGRTLSVQVFNTLIMLGKEEKNQQIKNPITLS